MILEMARQFVKPGPKAKFQNGDKVKVTGEDSPDRFRTYHGKKRMGLIGKEGTVIGYDYYPGAYSKFLVKFEDGSKDAIHSHFLVPAKTEGLSEGIDSVIQLVDRADLNIQAKAKEYLTGLAPYGYRPADENALAIFKKNLLRSGPFLNSFTKGQKSERSSFHAKNLKIYLTGVMKIFSTASSVQTVNDLPDYCMPAFDKANPVFYLWYANAGEKRRYSVGNIDELFFMSFPQLVGWSADHSKSMVPLDQNYNFVQVMTGVGIERVIKSAERVSMGKKPMMDYEEEGASLHRIGSFLSMLNMKGVEQSDMDALMAL